MPTNHDAAALPGHLDQCAITDARLHPNPLGIKFSPSHPPCDLQLDDQTAITKNNFFVISCMPGVDHQGNTHSNQFNPTKGVTKVAPMSQKKAAIPRETTHSDA